MTDEHIAQTLQNTPTPDQIKQQMEGQARIIGAAQTLGFITQQAQGMLTMLTNNNPRLALAIANELVLIYDEALRRNLQITNIAPPPALEKEVENV